MKKQELSGPLERCPSQITIAIFRRNLGLNEDVPLKTFDAPDNFYDGAEIFIVEDMPEIQRVSQTDYIEAVTDAVIHTVMATGGRLFVLFTSQDMLRKTYDLITESEQLEEYAFLHKELHREVA